jgi:hypothetical protein
MNKRPLERTKLGYAVLSCFVIAIGSVLGGLAWNRPPERVDAGLDERKADVDSSGEQEAAATKKNKPAAKDPATKRGVPAAKAERKLLGGRVVLLADALKRRKIPAYPEELKNQVVLETAKGELIPIVPDWRGRAFYQDERLRNRKVELIGLLRPGLPYLQVLVVYTFDERGTRQYTDYWCEICAIPMYEIQRCECCQGEIELRYQPKALPNYIVQPKAEPDSQ